MLAVGLSFWQCSHIFLATKQCTGVASLGSINNNTVSINARICFAMSMMKLKSILLYGSWTFSAAADVSNHHFTGYLDIHVCVYYKGKILNLHVIALPLHKSITTQNLTSKFKTVFNVLCPEWRSKMLAVTMDGEAKMTGCCNIFITNLDCKVSKELICMWCSAHQLDLVVH